MLEAAVETKLAWLKTYGFDVLKLTTPGNSGVMDRLILQPEWSPAPPAFVELKRPGKEERPLQAARRDNWRARGCDVRDMCDTIGKVVELCETLIVEAVLRYTTAGKCYGDLPFHIRNTYVRVIDGRL